MKRGKTEKEQGSGHRSQCIIALLYHTYIIINNNNQFNEIQTFLVAHWTKNFPLN
jgi:hypothetical protein